MKKLLIISILLFATFGGYAQFGSGVKIPLAIGDTILNTTTVSKVISATGGYSGAVVQVIGTAQTGTVAGIVRLFGSTDGVTYNRINPTDSLLMTASQLSYSFKVTGPLPPKIKATVVGSGTQHTLISVWYVLRKYSTTP